MISFKSIRVDYLLQWGHLKHSYSEVTDLIEGDRLSGLDRFVASSKANVEIRTELDLHLEENLLSRALSFYSLSWWKTN